jgi:hypothetical protein
MIQLMISDNQLTSATHVGECSAFALQFAGYSSLTLLPFFSFASISCRVLALSGMWVTTVSLTGKFATAQHHALMVMSSSSTYSFLKVISSSWSSAGALATPRHHVALHAALKVISSSSASTGAFATAQHQAELKVISSSSVSSFSSGSVVVTRGGTEGIPVLGLFSRDRVASGRKFSLWSVSK